MKNMPYYLGPKGYLAINSARGCPFKCSFCYNNLLHKGQRSYRAKSIEKVMEEVDLLTLRYKINKIQFMDDDFLTHRNRGFRLLKAIREKHPHIKFHLAARVDELNKEEFVKKLAEVGCESVFLGVESGSTEQLEQMAKGCSTSDTFDTAKLCKKYGITCVFSFTCGFPEETFDNLYESVETARILQEIDPESWSVMEIISPILGTPLYNDLKIKQEVPEMVPARWCYFSDWKSAKNKPWIQNQAFYEAYQLAFYFSFSSRGHASESRSLSKFLAKWSQMRLLRKKPRILPEFRLFNDKESGVGMNPETMSESGSGSN
ncbi:MAG: radical SAM protein [candidate division Zixibacteria bacterium]|nr:radical SAM protein [candidate division Zixibacteria bacterium]